MIFEVRLDLSLDDPRDDVLGLALLFRLRFGDAPFGLEHSGRYVVPRRGSRGAAGLAMCSATSFTRRLNSSVLATKSVSQFTSMSTPTVLLKWM